MSADRLADLKRYEQLRLESSLSFYKPYPKQFAFHALGKTKRERMLMAANRVGKCNSISTLIETDQGELALGDIWGKEINVLTWPDKTPRRVVKWVAKPAEACFRITLDNGRWFECPIGHRVLISSDGEYASIGQIFACLPKSVFHARGFLPSVQQGAARWYGRLRGLWGRCVNDFRLHGERPLCDQEGVRVCVPLSSGAPGHSLLWWRVSGLADKCRDILSELLFHLSTQYVAHQISARCDPFANLTFWQNDQRQTCSNRISRQFSRVEDPERIGVSTSQDQPSVSSQRPTLYGNKIVSVDFIGVHPLYDMEVEERGNYYAAGVVHHNTYSAANELGYHLTGFYPDWWPGLRFTKPGRWGIGSKTAELTRDGAQKMLLGPFGRFGTGAIPKSNLIDYKLSRGIPEAVDIFRVRHSSGGIAEGVLKAYADGREKWQADEWQGAWLDEEAPEDIYSEASARTAVTSGPILTTLTPLLGMSDVVRRFYPDQGHPDRGLVMMALDEAEHFDAESRRKAIESYLPHERDARTKGLPMLGEGAVYPVSEDMLSEDILDVPAWWPQLIAIDFGWHDHPTAAVKAAWDRDNDCVHITAVYKQSKQPLVVYAAGIKAMGDHPVAWPHDGLMHDKSSGTQIAQLYKQQGLRMLSEHAQFPDDRKNGTEAAVWEALARMQTNRLKVARHLSQWFEECRSYHRKDGKVVAEHDDLMKATHYLLMMLRYATAGERAPQKQDRYARRRNARQHTWMSA